MSYDETIDARLQKLFAPVSSVDSRTMFGGVCYLYHGYMFCRVEKHFLILRREKEQTGKILGRPWVPLFDITGQAMKGWGMVDEEGFTSDDKMRRRVNEAMRFSGALPAK